MKRPALVLAFAGLLLAGGAIGRDEPLTLPAIIGAADAPAVADSIYRVNNGQLFWLDRNDTRARLAGVERTAGLLEDNGLDASGLRNAMHATVLEAAEQDREITKRMIEAALALNAGVLPPNGLGPAWAVPPPPPLSVDALAEGFSSDPVDTFMASLAPANPEYKGLSLALRQYLVLARNGVWPIIGEQNEIRLDGTDPREGVLATRLAAEDDAMIGWSGDHIAIKDALAHFQRRHGLEPDGRAGLRTLAALDVSPAARAAQIAANLERWRHVPRELGAIHIMVNAADGALVLSVHGETATRMRAITGDRRHATPSFSASIEAITFNPAWSIPASIAAREILPKLKRNPRYLTENDMVIVGREPDRQGLGVDWPAYQARGFPFQLRQLPGPNNALGVVKFEMANPFSIYFHDTPRRGLFARVSRNLSHGCVRLEHPRELAERLLDLMSPQDTPKVADILDAGQTKTIRLGAKVPAHILYFTAVIDDDGAVGFRDDVYLRDPPIIKALGLPAPGSETLPRPAEEPTSCDAV